MNELNLYFHTPYCRARCRFCSFYVLPGRQSRVEEYFKCLESEALKYKDTLSDYKITTIFAGGGTPSLMDPELITNFIKFLRDNFNISKDAEISIESAPETLTEEKLDKYLEAGFNRLSIGLQAWQNHVLKFMGRLYKIEDFLKYYELAKKSGFNNINIDLIFGIPNQKLSEWSESLDGVISLNPEHISCYSLDIDEESIFGIMEKKGMLTRLEEELDREMYHLACEKLQNSGYRHYEISNWSRPGFECTHNSSLWEGKDYLGFGASAYSKFNKQRYRNPNSLEKYISKIQKNEENREEIENVDPESEILEYIILRLRMMKGIDLKEFNSRFNKKFEEIFQDSLNKLKSQELINYDSEAVSLTLKGQDLENVVGGYFV